MLTFYAKGKDARIDTIKKSFIPVVLDGYLRGDEAELKFQELFRVQGNGFTYVTAGGHPLGHDSYRSLESENAVSRLEKVLDDFAKLPEEHRRPRVEAPTAAGDSARVPLTPPPGALIANVYFTYLENDRAGNWRRALWHVEGQPGTEAGSGHGRNQFVTHIDKLWLQEDEWRALVPAEPRAGLRVPLPHSMESRLLRFYAGDLAHRTTRNEVRSAELILSVDKVTERGISLKLEGHTETGSPFEPDRPDRHGVDLRWLGHLHYSTQTKVFDRFDVVAFGEGWGGGRDQAATTNYYRGGEHRRWPMGIAFELVTRDRPVDRLPPQNANHYRTGNAYFAPDGVR